MASDFMYFELRREYGTERRRARGNNHGVS